MANIVKNKNNVLKKLEELEFFSKAGVGQKLHYEFLKNFNSQETRNAYYSDLKHFFEFYKMAFKKTIRHPKEITRAHIIAYKDFIIDCGGQDQGKASNLTVRRKMATLSSYFKFMLEKQVIEFNPVDGIKRPKKEPNKGTECLSEGQVRLLLDYLDLDIKLHPEFLNYLHRTLIYCLFYTGIRVTELINIKRQDIINYSGMPVLKIISKGSKHRLVPLHPKIKTILKEYLKIAKPKFKKLYGEPMQADDYIFFSPKNHKNLARRNLSRYGVYKILKQKAFQAGVPQNISPHSARATLITSLLEQGHDLYRVSISVGHANPETTKIYDKRLRSVKDNAILELDY